VTVGTLEPRATVPFDADAIVASNALAVLSERELCFD